MCLSAPLVLAGAVALLRAGFDSDRIRMIGLWRSDEMYIRRYVLFI
jgi:hypothetical protein